jgi:hypothetical protein
VWFNRPVRARSPTGGLLPFIDLFLEKTDLFSLASDFNPSRHLLQKPESHHLRSIEDCRKCLFLLFFIPIMPNIASWKVHRLPIVVLISFSTNSNAISSPKRT